MNSSSSPKAATAGAVPGAGELARHARRASRTLARLPHEARNSTLLAAADAIEKNASWIFAANAEDCAAAEKLVATGEMSAAMLARLRVSQRGVAEMAARVRDVTRLPDPLGRRLAATKLDEGLILVKESCSLGVIAVVFESRPDVIPQVASLALKSGNALLLKGGAEAAHTNEALAAIWEEALEAHGSIPRESVALLHSRAEVMELLRLAGVVDLLIPRGSKAFIEQIRAQSAIPVLAHGEGVCHVYVDAAADMNKALAIVMDAKTQYPAACNAAETLLIHESIAPTFLPQAAGKLRDAGVELRGCAATRRLLAGQAILVATEADWSAEYSDLILAVRVVPSVEAAIEHIHQYGSGHTECIVTEDSTAAAAFLDEIDAAGVYHNASTRFADGFRYGFGAEVGISTGKLHARGPVGLDGLTSYKYKLFGSGQTVGEYARGERHFLHEPIK
jgi:glutamate-5-semialdehyde dehydrogenase